MRFRALLACLPCAWLVRVEGLALAQDPPAEARPKGVGHVCAPVSNQRTDLSADALEQARAHRDRGAAALQDARYHDAAAEYAQEYAFDKRPIALLNEAIALSELARFDESDKLYQQFLDVVGESAPPACRDWVASQIRAPAKPVPTPKLASLTLDTNPPGASVALDGTELGVTPLGYPRDLPPGEHALSIRLAGYQSQQRVVVLLSGQLLRLQVELVPLPRSAELDILCAVPDARWEIDGRVDAAHEARRAISLGAHHLRFSAHGYRARDIRLEIDSGRPQTIQCDLERPSKTQRIVALLTGSGGIVAGGVALGLYVDNGRRYRQWQSMDAVLRADWATPPPRAPDLQQRQTSNDQLAHSIETRDAVSLGLGIGGGVLLAVGIGLFVTDPASAD